MIAQTVTYTNEGLSSGQYIGTVVYSRYGEIVGFYRYVFSEPELQKMFCSVVTKIDFVLDVTKETWNAMIREVNRHIELPTKDD